ncbi:DNA recombination protein RmuC [Mesoplasma lactucae]|uniref:DNA recombination protein RmuC n=1 Tax=Mesoplasma lactucae ATCC 49193 TaxID=81460 RepID=A0A291IR98_9MOLU|nr:DNA recombination protein RmuC [Mesoplasma lactucae]ATG97465.1 DNA recombination protein RmuC [Mesoplasma lactucae ATCC 49193]ATZ20080.1 DNA recombination protein [Mesoplasma lactucae ATCC 49193]MCL8216828.1 hypothetical protein [Mesoplasma lactucae ATCC 49193]
MNTGLYILLGIILVVLLVLIGVLIYFIKSRKDNTNNNLVNKNDFEHASELSKREHDNIDEAIKMVDTKLEKFKDSTNTNDIETAKTLTSLKENLNILKTYEEKAEDGLIKQNEKLTNRFNDVINGMNLLLKNVQTSDEKVNEIGLKVNNINNIFTNNNKTRGTIGEYVLDKILSDVYGFSDDLWEKQYKMPDGNIIDAIVKTGKDKEDILVDAKFPLTNYNNYLDTDDKGSQDRYKKDFEKDVRQKVDEVAKYINKTNGISNAIMFIPSEEIFSFIYANFQTSVIDYAIRKHVWITSPTTLSAFLFLLDKQNADKKLTENLQTIKEQILSLKTEFDRFSTRWENVKSSNDKMTKSIKELDITQDKIEKRYNAIYSQDELKQFEE